jgi:hypothetical protein
MITIDVARTLLWAWYIVWVLGLISAFLTLAANKGTSGSIRYGVPTLVFIALSTYVVLNV